MIDSRQRLRYPYRSMKKLLRAIPSSFYSQALYREVGRQWKGFGFLYILLVLTLFLIPITMQRISKLNDFLYGEENRSNPETLHEIVQGIAAQIPAMQIKNGILSVENATQPYTITHPRTQQPIAIIDTTGAVASLADQAAPILLTEKAMILRSTHAGEDVIGLAELVANFGLQPAHSVLITQKTLERWQEAASIIFIVGPYVLGLGDLLASFMAFALRALLFAGFGLLICALFRKEMTFSTLLRLAAIASTPVIACEMLSFFFGVSLFANKNLVYFLMHGAYLYHAVEANVRSRVA